MNFRIRIILAQISLFASLSLILFSAQAEMIEVGPGHGYSRIQDAIDAASPGDTIYVGNGTYFESINVTKQLIPYQEDRALTTFPCCSGIRHRHRH